MRIERLWVDVTAQVGATWADHFLMLELHHGLDINNSHHIWLLHQLFLNIINQQLAFFANSWNQHQIQIRNGPNRSPADMFGFDMITNGVRGDQLPPEDGMTEEELEVHGIDWEALRDERLLASREDNNDRGEGSSSWVGRQGPPAELSEVTVNPPVGVLSNDQLASLMQVLRPWIGSSDRNDIVHAWTTALAIVRTMTTNTF